MSLFEEVDSLQREWTDRFVQVDGSVAELRRFAGLTGQVKTVNMSGQALVEFDGSEDIGWYDIHPQFLTVVEVEVAATAPEAAPAADTSKLSPLELARMQDVGGAASASASVSVSKAPAAKKEAAEKAPAAAAPAKQKPAAPKAADTSKLSPLELARMQDIGGDAPAPAAVAEQEAVAAEETAAEENEAEDNAVAEQAPAKAPAAAPAVDTSKLSPLELARMQDIGGDAPAPAAVAEPEAVAAEETAAEENEAEDNAVAEQAPAKAPAAAPAVDTSKLSPLELARMQDAGGDAPAPAAAAEEEAAAEETPAEEEDDEQEVSEDVAAEEEATAEEPAADDSPASSVEIPDELGPERTAAVLAACRAQDGG